MQTRDHYLLGCYLLERNGTRLDPIRKRLFLLGCIKPDLNLITYARGSLKYCFLRGHNAENAREHLTCLIEKLERSGVHTPLQWFRFGAVLHYLADSFTFAHNRSFGSNLKEHKKYEEQLHAVFVGQLYSQNIEPISAGAACHARYLREEPSCMTDCRYIIGSALCLCGRLSVDRRSDRIGVVLGSEGG